MTKNRSTKVNKGLPIFFQWHIAASISLHNNVFYLSVPFQNLNYISDNQFFCIVDDQIAYSRSYGMNRKKKL